MLSHSKHVKRRIDNNSKLYEIGGKKETVTKKHGVSFYSFTVRTIKPDTFATIFIVRTDKPILWNTFIERVTRALADVL